jgi:hypothetical protein
MALAQTRLTRLLAGFHSGVLNQALFTARYNQIKAIHYRLASGASANEDQIALLEPRFNRASVALPDEKIVRFAQKV